MGSSFWVPNAPSPSTDLVLCTAQEQFLVSPQEETRLWIKNAEGFFERLCNTHITVLDAALKSGQLVIMETQNRDGTWTGAQPQAM